MEHKRSSRWLWDVGGYPIWLEIRSEEVSILFRPVYDNLNRLFVHLVS